MDPLNTSGVIYVRKRRGRKLNFMIGGPTLAEAADLIRWDLAAQRNEVFFFSSDATGLVGIVKPVAAP